LKEKIKKILIGISFVIILIVVGIVIAKKYSATERATRIENICKLRCPYLSSLKLYCYYAPSVCFPRYEECVEYCIAWETQFGNK
jgi:hypothetical protein